MSERERTWDDVIKRFARFQAQSSLGASGVRVGRGQSQSRTLVEKQLAKCLGLTPADPFVFEESHLTAMLERRGMVVRGLGRRPSNAPLWNGLFRMIVFERDDYRCDFCERSAEHDGVPAQDVGEDPAGPPVEGPLALRLELDHRQPRANGGDDYSLDNVRAVCRTCNVGRGRMTDRQFEAELKSLMAGLANRYGEPHVRWVEDKTLAAGGGHGVDFYLRDRHGRRALFAVVDGFTWLRGGSATIEVRVLPGTVSKADLAGALRQVEKYVRRGTLKLASLADGVHAHING